MEDESKANWPEKMQNECSNQGQHRIWVGSGIYIASLHNEDVEGVTELQYDAIAESRARQICALPAMVALLKEISEQTLYCDTGEYEATDFHYDAKAILAQIGEIE